MFYDKINKLVSKVIKIFEYIWCVCIYFFDIVICILLFIYGLYVKF